jgi:predicted ATPase
MLSNTSIRNFKSIQKIINLELKPLTILTGVNSSGKSNILEAISFFAQASRYRDHTPKIGAIFTDGELKKYPYEIEKYVPFKGEANSLVTLKISVRMNESLVEGIKKEIEENKKVFKYIFPKKTITETIPQSFFKTVGYSISFRLSDPKFYSQKILINEEIVVKVNQNFNQPSKIVHPKVFEKSGIVSPLDDIFNTDAFRIHPGTTLTYPHVDELIDLLEVANLILLYIKNYAKDIYFISGERGQINIEETIRDRQTETTTPSWVGSQGQYLMEILSRCQIQNPEKFIKIQEWAEKFQLSNIRAGYIGRNKLESEFHDDVLEVSMNSALAGLGSRQILSVITQIFWSEPESLIMIEEPEISLHPQNQVLLHELFAEAISEGKQIVCSTHSPFFVLALSKIIRKKLLNLDDIAVYHVNKDFKGTHVELMPLNKHGFVKKGIPSFMEVEEDLFKDWSESLEEE